MTMLIRFSLYGFLKNLQFFEPFLILYFLDAGLNFFQIGILISFRSICINLMEIPSGALADLYGRKNSMVFSLSSYIVSFLLFSFIRDYPFFFIAMFFFSIGEAFRTGTHKAMIFHWLRKNNRLNNKTQIYGYTRSWSKTGSAVSVIISMIIVLTFKDYRWIFIFSIIPYIAGILNIINYPAYLNNLQANKNINLRTVFLHLYNSLKQSVLNKGLRKLILQSMVFEGVFTVSGDYLQPVLKAQSVVLAAIFILPERESTAVVVGIVYFILYIISSAAARNSYRLVKKTDDEKKALTILILTASIILLLAAIGLYLEYYAITIISFILFFVIQNFWRPILIAQFDNFAGLNEQATILSIESQAKSAGTFILAPVVGLLADSFGIGTAMAALALLLLVLGIFSKFRRQS